MLCSLVLAYSILFSITIVIFFFSTRNRPGYNRIHIYTAGRQAQTMKQETRKLIAFTIREIAYYYCCICVYNNVRGGGEWRVYSLNIRLYTDINNISYYYYYYMIILRAKRILHGAEKPVNTTWHNIVIIILLV